jgi:hypothetical protein
VCYTKCSHTGLRPTAHLCPAATVGPTTMNTYLKKRTVAKRLNISEATLDRLVRTGQFPKPTVFD